MTTARKYLILLAWLIVTLAELAFAESVKFAWDVPALERGVTLTDLRKKHIDGSTTFLVSSDGTTATVNLPPGLHVIVATDFSLAGWSEFSDPVTVIVPEKPPRRWTLDGNIITTGDGECIRVVIMFSPNMQHWTDRPSPSARFFRIQAESP